MRFDEYLKFVPDSRKEFVRTLEDDYFSMLDVNGSIPQYTVCFHVDFQDKEKLESVLKFFNPVIVWFGQQEDYDEFNRSQISNRYHSGVFGWFEESVVIVVNKIPVSMLQKKGVQ